MGDLVNRGEKRMDKTKRWILLSVIALLVIINSTNVDIPAYVLAADEYGNVHGTVVDEDDQPLYDVKVMAYSSSGSLEATEYTDEDGFFRFSLGGSYTIIFEKEGYATVEKSITVTDAPVSKKVNDPVKMGKIVLQKALTMSASVLSRVVNPGDTILLPFSISYIGEEDEEVDFSIDSPEGWETRILDQTGEIKRVFLSEGSLSLNLEVTVPSTASGDAIVSLTASGLTSSTLYFMLHTHIEREIELTSTFPYVSAELGRTIYYPLSIKNTGETEETLDLIGVVPEGWKIYFVTGDQMEVLSLYLTAGQSESLTVKVVQPDEVAVGEYVLSVNAVSGDGGLRDSLDLGVNLREVTSDVEVISTYTDVTFEAGEEFEYPITIWNQGDNEVLFLVAVLSVPDKWDAVFTSEDTEVSSFLVLAGESMNLELKVDPPSIVDTGSYPIKILVESDDGVISEVIELRASVVGSYKLNMELSTLYETINIGASEIITVEVSNWGQSPVTTIYIEAEAPEDWEVSITPVQVASLGPKESTRFTIVTETPADTVAGDYLIGFTAISDQVESDEAELRLTAKASTSWGFIGIGVVVVVIIVLIVMFMRFKRR